MSQRILGLMGQRIKAMDELKTLGLLGQQIQAMEKLKAKLQLLAQATAGQAPQIILNINTPAPMRINLLNPRIRTNVVRAIEEEIELAQSISKAFVRPSLTIVLAEMGMEEAREAEEIRQKAEEAKEQLEKFGRDVEAKVSEQELQQKSRRITALVKEVLKKGVGLLKSLKDSKIRTSIIGLLKRLRQKEIERLTILKEAEEVPSEGIVVSSPTEAAQPTPQIPTPLTVKIRIPAPNSEHVIGEYIENLEAEAFGPESGAINAGTSYITFWWHIAQGNRQSSLHLERTGPHNRDSLPISDYFVPSPPNAKLIVVLWDTRPNVRTHEITRDEIEIRLVRHTLPRIDVTFPEAGEEVPRRGISRRQLLRMGLGAGAVAAGVAAAESISLKRKRDRELADVKWKVSQQVDERLQLQFEKSVRIEIRKMDVYRDRRDRKILNILYVIFDSSNNYKDFDAFAYLQRAGHIVQYRISGTPKVPISQPVDINDLNGNYNFYITVKPKGSNLRSISSRFFEYTFK